MVNNKLAGTKTSSKQRKFQRIKGDDFQEKIKF
jgi:hypothetical protein